VRNGQAIPTLRELLPHALSSARNPGARRDEEADQEVVENWSSTHNRPEFRRVRVLKIYFSTAVRLGAANVARVVMHRFCKRAGVYRWLLPRHNAVPLRLDVGSLRDTAHAPVSWADRAVLMEAEELLAGRANYFSAHTQVIGSPPDWFLNPFQNRRHPQPTCHWSKIADSSTEVGDIKVFWEMSRFTWALVFARAWRISGDVRYVSALRFWIEDWWKSNPPNAGPNWMCGQETSIRLTNTLLAFRLAGVEEKVAPELTTFVETHCRRIDLTRSYALAQDNNHATSEAAGLFVGGTWLTRFGKGSAKYRGQRWAKRGRELLASRISQLVLPDGSFSQHSLTYHRLMLDTLCVAEAWRRHMSEARFSESFYTRAVAATRWLGAMIDPATGDGPNLGPNDGAHPYRLDASAYRDFRSCLQSASLLFTGTVALEPGPWNESANWLGIRGEGAARPWFNELSSAVFPDGGYVVMRNRTYARVLLRAPTAQFRPAHADALHLDLWWKGENILRDGGTYSYGGDDAVAATLSSVVGHNVYQFDGHDQMPRLSRFLYGDWVRVVGAATITTNPDGQSWTGSYTDAWGAQHKRTVTLRDDALCVLDQIQGFRRKAVLRWHLNPANWSLNATGCVSTMVRISVESSVPIRHISLRNSWESRHYLEKSTRPVLEVEIGQSPAFLTTTITLS
jgi:Heparinase II/III-like protein/Heparinase II/III N-terminus